MGDGDPLFRSRQTLVYLAQAPRDLPAGVRGLRFDRPRGRRVSRPALASVLRALGRSRAIRGLAPFAVVVGTTARFGGHCRADLYPPRLAGSDPAVGDRDDHGPYRLVYFWLHALPAHFRPRAIALSHRADVGVERHGAGRGFGCRAGDVEVAGVQHWRGHRCVIWSHLCRGAGDHPALGIQSGDSADSLLGSDALFRQYLTCHAAGDRRTLGSDILRDAHALLVGGWLLFWGDAAYGC